MEQFSVLHDNNGIFTDYSQDASSFGRDSFVLDLVASEDYLYVGYRKLWDYFYTEMNVANTASAEFSAEYYDGTSWIPVEGFRDESKGFSRSGFLSFTKPSDWASVAVNGSTLYWVRYRPNNDLDVTTEVQGLAIVFSNDEDLKGVYHEVMKKLPRDGTVSYILKHEEARREIVQTLRRRSLRKEIPEADLVFRHVTEFDLLHADEEIRHASKYWVLANIFLNVHDDTDGLNLRLYDKYDQRFNEHMETFYLSYDKNDNGVEDQSENLLESRIEIIRP